MRYKPCLTPLTLIIATLLLAGCSKDRHVFESTIHQPMTITVVDTVDEQAIWSYDIPTEHKLVVDFNQNGQENPNQFLNDGYATVMNYALYPITKRRDNQADQYSGRALDRDRVDLPNHPVRIDVTYRPGPEMPPSENDVILDTEPAPLPVPDLDEAVERESQEAEQVEEAATTEE